MSNCLHHELVYGHTNQQEYFYIQPSLIKPDSTTHRFLWHSQKWIITMSNEQKPTEPSRKIVKRTHVRRALSPENGTTFVAEEYVKAVERDVLRENTWRKRDVNVSERFLLVLSSKGSIPNEKFTYPTLSYGPVHNHNDFDATYNSDDENEPQRPNGALALLKYSSEKLIYLEPCTRENDFEASILNAKLSYEPPVVWADAYQNIHGLSTSHFQLSERFGISCETRLFQVTTRRGNLSDFSLSLSEVSQIKKLFKRKVEVVESKYMDLPNDMLVIDKVDGKESDCESEDEGFEEILLLPDANRDNESIRKNQPYYKLDSEEPNVYLKDGNISMDLHTSGVKFTNDSNVIHSESVNGKTMATLPGPPVGNKAVHEVDYSENMLQQKYHYVALATEVIIELPNKGGQRNQDLRPNATYPLLKVEPLRTEMQIQKPCRAREIRKTETITLEDQVSCKSLIDTCDVTNIFERLENDQLTFELRNVLQRGAECGSCCFMVADEEVCEKKRCFSSSLLVGVKGDCDEIKRIKCLKINMKKTKTQEKDTIFVRNKSFVNETCVECKVEDNPMIADFYGALETSETENLQKSDFYSVEKLEPTKINVADPEEVAHHKKCHPHQLAATNEDHPVPSLMLEWIPMETDNNTKKVQRRPRIQTNAVNEQRICRSEKAEFRVQEPFKDLQSELKRADTVNKHKNDIIIDIYAKESRTANEYTNEDEFDSSDSRRAICNNTSDSDNVKPVTGYFVPLKPPADDTELRTQPKMLDTNVNQIKPRLHKSIIKRQVKKIVSKFKSKPDESEKTEKSACRWSFRKSSSKSYEQEKNAREFDVLEEGLSIPFKSAGNVRRTRSVDTILNSSPKNVQRSTSLASYQRSEFDWPMGVVKCKDYSPNVVARDTDKELSYIRKERQKQLQSNSLKSIEKKHKNAISSVGKIVIPRAFSVDDIDSITEN